MKLSKTSQIALPCWGVGLVILSLSLIDIRPAVAAFFGVIGLVFLFIPNQSK